MIGEDARRGKLGNGERELYKTRGAESPANTLDTAGT